SRGRPDDLGPAKHKPAPDVFLGQRVDTDQINGQDQKTAGGAKATGFRHLPETHRIYKVPPHGSVRSDDDDADGNAQEHTDSDASMPDRRPAERLTFYHD